MPGSICKATTHVASFPSRRRNGLPTSTSSNYYFFYLKVYNTYQISECHLMTTVKPNCIMHWNGPCSHTDSISIAVAQSHQCRCSARWFFFRGTSVYFISRNCSKWLPSMSRKALFSQLEVSQAPIRYSLLDWDMHCHDIAPVYSLNLLKLPGRFPYSLGMGLLHKLTYMIACNWWLS